jgi:hypothetical protein
VVTCVLAQLQLLYTALALISFEDFHVHDQFQGLTAFVSPPCVITRWLFVVMCCCDSVPWLFFVLTCHTKVVLFIIAGMPSNITTTLEPLVGPWPLLQFRNHFYADSRTPWPSDQTVTRPLPKQRTTNRINAHRYPCPEWDSNPRSQCSNERRQFMPHTARGHCDR